MQAQEAAPGFLPDPYINLGNHQMMARRRLSAMKVFPKHPLDAFRRTETGIVPIELVDNQGSWNSLLSPIHTIIQSSNSSWSLGPGEIISRPPPNHNCFFSGALYHQNLL